MRASADRNITFHQVFHENSLSVGYFHRFDRHLCGFYQLRRHTASVLRFHNSQHTTRWWRTIRSTKNWYLLYFYFFCTFLFNESVIIIIFRSTSHAKNKFMEQKRFVGFNDSILCASGEFQWNWILSSVCSLFRYTCGLLRAQEFTWVFNSHFTNKIEIIITIMSVMHLGAQRH